LPCADLEPTFVNSKVAQHGLSLQGKQDLSQFIGIEASGPLYRLDKQLASGIGIGRLDGWSAVELLLIRSDKLLVSGIRKTCFPERAAVDELRLLSEPLIIVGE